MTELIVGAALGITGILLAASQLKLRGQLTHANSVTADTLNRALAAEREKAKAEAELTFLQQSIVTMMQRPVLASITDAQIHDICQTLSQIVVSYMTPKERQN